MSDLVAQVSRVCCVPACLTPVCRRLIVLADPGAVSADDGFRGALDGDVAAHRAALHCHHGLGRLALAADIPGERGEVQVHVPARGNADPDVSSELEPAGETAEAVMTVQC